MNPGIGTVATAEIDGQQYMGVNSNGPGYTREEWDAARDMRDRLVSRYPDILDPHEIGRRPNDAFFHAETHLLLRAARERGGTLEGLEFSVYVDNPLCWSCGRALPLIVREIGNPIVHFVSLNGRIRTLANGDWRN